MQEANIAQASLPGKLSYVIHSMGMPFNGDTIKTRSLGGSETAAYYLARELASRGHRVVVFTNSQEEGTFNGVIYCWSGPATQQNPLGERFAHFACNTPHDVLVIQRHPLAFHKDYASKINVLQMHDLALKRSAGPILAGGARFDLVTGVSQFHIDQIKSVYGLPDRTLRVVPNGVDLDLYEDEEPTGPASIVDVFKKAGKFNLLYQSRPERGLEHLLRPGGIMEKLQHGGSNAHLFYCGYDNTVAEMAAFYDELNQCALKLPNVTNLGALTKAELAQVQMNCELLVYPTEFEEVSCITAMEAMAARLPMLTSAHAALPETCKDSGTVLLPLKDGAVDESLFATNIQALEVDAQWLGELRTKQALASEMRTWEHAVDIFEERVAEVFKRRGASPARMARHLIEHSDILAVDQYAGYWCDGPASGWLVGTKDDSIALRALDERAKMYAFAKSPEAMAAHYSHWEGLNCDRLAEVGLNPKKEREGLIITTRYRGIEHLLRQAIADKLESGEDVTVLEFGCAHGHVTLALAEAFPKVQFLGIDFMERSIQLARESAADAGIKNAEFRVGSIEDLGGQYDVVIAPEVLEHIWDYRAALERFLGAVKTGGELILTTPTGRWEWTGRENWHKGRQHLHHFERVDLEELFAGFQHTILHAPAGHDVSGGPVGSWVTSVTKSGGELGSIDYGRKLASQAPRDTVSLCMIVRDAQDSIGLAVRSVANFVDEVVIAVDPGTKDRTYARIYELQEQFPNLPFKVFEGKSPLDIGFDEARNATIEASCGDWILWMDADEEAVGAQNLFRLLRPGAYDGYAIAQHHMSQLPAERISTDYPTRLFRRDSGARFFGVVHEHPEVQIGKAVPHTHQLGDFSLLHYGYVDEATRRARHRRNFPLLLRDLEKHPPRIINKFLYLRDLAQMIAYEGEQTGGVSEGMANQAKRAIELFDQLIDANPMFRMTLDAVPYYSTAVAVLGGGFQVKFSIETKKAEFPGVSAVANIDGLFHSVETYTRFMARTAKETSQNYEGKYI